MKFIDELTFPSSRNKKNQINTPLDDKKSGPLLKTCNTVKHLSNVA